MSVQLKVGLIVNPIAGMGGKVGLHGTDLESFAVALSLGAQPTSGLRTVRALAGLVNEQELFDFYAAAGVMGGDYLEEAGISYTRILNFASDRKSGAGDTRAIASSLIEVGVDIILFSGGDGTARDIFSVIGGKIPIIGIPAGVKMRSEVFGIYPESIAGILISQAQSSVGTRVREAEILDVSELPNRNGIWDTELFGVALTPNATQHIQCSKISGESHADIGLCELANAMAKEMAPGKLYLIGPGRSAHLILQEQGLVGSFVGVDALVDGQVIGRDLSEDAILALLERFEKRELILGVIGGQGFLLGRGNQQISARVISAIGFDAITIMASARKISALIPARLHIDLGESDIYPLIPQYIQVHTAPNRTILCSTEVPANDNVMTTV
ncbi:MAG: NAD(+)/NADH kinase [Actinobacteria bacterium]|nr:NAD(+)/NADH kinase [Actinomycetota bacterium]